MDGLREYLLIKFVPETTLEKRKPFVDCTRAAWAYLCPKRRCLVTKFMGPPYDEESNTLLESLLKLKADAPEDWPTYPIEVKGQVDTYEEAMSKLSRLEVSEYVFTTDSEVDPHKKAILVENRLKSRKLICTENTKKILSTVPRMGSDFENHEIETSTSDSDSTDSSKKEAIKNRRSSENKKGKDKRKTPKFSTKVLPPLKKNKIVEPSPSTFMSSLIVRAESSNPQSHINPSSKNDYIQSKENTSKINDGIGNIASNLNQGDPEVFAVQKIIEKNTSDKNKTKDLIVQKKNKSARNDDLPLLLSALKGLSVDMKEVLANQRTILHYLGKTDAVKEQLFTEKYKLKVPFQTEDQFVELNEKLKNDDGFRTEFCSSLSYLFDRELNLSKSLTNILKKYFSRMVILKFTAQKRVLGKRLMKETTFYECVADALLQTHKNPGDLRRLTEDTVSKALGKILNNAKDWEGERQKRAILQKKVLEDQESTKTQKIADSEERVREDKDN